MRNTIARPMDPRYRSSGKTFLTLAIGVLLNGCSSAPKAPTTSDYPTLTRVEYVLQCMERHGGQSYDTLYPCVCSIDKLAEQLSYEDFAEAQVFTYMRSTPGEQGGLFRDPPQAKQLGERLEQAEAAANNACFVKD